MKEHKEKESIVRGHKQGNLSGGLILEQKS